VTLGEYLSRRVERVDVEDAADDAAEDVVAEDAEAAP
jgi:hypothetical protein